MTTFAETNTVELAFLQSLRLLRLLCLVILKLTLLQYFYEELQNVNKKVNQVPKASSNV